MSRGMKAVVAALGIDPEQLQIIIHQMVTLRRGGELVRVSKRTGDLITLEEVMEEVGVDACRFFFLARSASSQMDFDLELAKNSLRKIRCIMYNMLTRALPVLCVWWKSGKSITPMVIPGY